MVLERAPEVHEERVPHEGQHEMLVIGMLDLLHLDNVLLAQHLDRVAALVVLRAHKVHTTERAGAYRAQHFKVAQLVSPSQVANLQTSRSLDLLWGGWRARLLYGLRLRMAAVRLLGQHLHRVHGAGRLVLRPLR